MKLPEVIVYSKGAVSSGDRIEWRDGDVVVELTGCKVVAVKRAIQFGEVPVVEVHLLARLVEKQEGVES